MASWFDYTINGLIIGNIYALLAVGLALIFGVSRLINFAHGSVYLVGAYAGLVAETRFGLPLPLTFVIVIAVGALLGLLIERFGLRPLQGYAHIAPLLATIGISFVLDQLVQIFFSPDPRALPSDLLDKRYPLGSGTIGALDLVIAAVGLTSGGLLYYFLRFTKLGWAVRATAQDRDAAQQMGVDVNAVNRTVFAIASGLGAVSGLLVGMYYNYIDTAMSFQATLKGVVAQVVGGVGNVPGAIAGSLLLGLVESYGIALFGTSYRNLFAFVLLVIVLVLRPNGLFATGRRTPPEPMTGTFIAPSRPLILSPRTLMGIAVALAVLPFVYADPYVMQTLTNAWLYAMLGLSLTLIAGTAGLISLGHAALLAIGGYASALLAINFGMPVALAIFLAGLIAAALGTLLVFPSFRLRGHYFSIATLAVGEIVSLVILNWDGLTRGPIGLSGIPPLSLFGVELESAQSVYWFALAVLVVLVMLQFRLLASHLGRVLRAVRDDDVAARSYGIRLDRYKALAFAFGSFAAGIAGAVSAHQYSYINHETFTAQLSILALTIVILGGMGNVVGAIVGSVLLIGLSEVLRVVSGLHIGAYEVPDLRILVYGITLLLLVRFRPQGLFGTV